MSTAQERIVLAARAALGVRFRLHGRDMAHGFDCVGLVAHALRAGGFCGAVPSGYALRGGDAAKMAAHLSAAGLVPARMARAGDVVLFATGPAQFHLAIDTGGSIIHADAVLRRVVERPGSGAWPIIGRWQPLTDADF
ncbi:MAG: NlpC/P60 family protein [Sphingomonas sp.]